MSKIDPTQFKTLDRKSTMLLQAARQNTEKVERDDISGIEDPGIDSIRGTFGGLGSLIRAKSARKMSMSTGRSNSTSTVWARVGHGTDNSGEFRDGLQRHQLYDTPMTSMPSMSAGSDAGSAMSPPRTSTNVLPPRTPTIKFDSQEIVHTNTPTKGGSAVARHEQRDARRAHNLISSPSPRLGLSGLPPVEEGAEPRPLHSILNSPQKKAAPRVDVGARTLPPIELTDPFASASSPFSQVSNPFSPVSPAGNPFLPVNDPYERTSSIMTTRGGTSHLNQNPISLEEDYDSPAWRERLEHGQRQTSRRPSGRQNYLTSDDDKEESMSLVRPPLGEGGFDANDDDDDYELPYGGIRLVGTTPSPTL